jgi:PadR family transcriptional regulator
MIPKALVAASIRPFVLSVLMSGPSYGYEIIQRVHQITEGDVKWSSSTLYPVLHKLENERLLDSFWQDVEKGPARKYYRLTSKGRARLETERLRWMRVHAALMSLWEPNPGIAPA